MTESEPYIVDWAEKAAGLVEVARDEQTWYEAMAPALLRPDDRVAVDVGCGGGGMTLALAAALGERGRVVAVDGEPELLAAVRAEVAARAGERLRSRGRGTSRLHAEHGAQYGVQSRDPEVMT